MADLFDSSKAEKQPLAARMPSKKRPPAFSFSRVFSFVKNSGNFLAFWGSAIRGAIYDKRFSGFANFAAVA
ncbi:MAG: hypothetical protein IJJ71_06060 [Treponema sp.]|uniref:hypothetical protein n=1 Tax=Treponema sp. TaxID=166 RepID=UPI0025EFD1DB|nr:hypothetical protein [Treponema sp.]MBR0495718.1 hypothetical protein [Treponema sp.]